MPNEIRDISSKDAESFDYIFEQNVSIPLKSSEGVVRCNVYLPKSAGTEKFPVLITYGPYGKGELELTAIEIDLKLIRNRYSVFGISSKVLQ